MGTQRKKPRPFVAATKPLDTPNLKKKAPSRPPTVDNGAPEERANGDKPTSMAASGSTPAATSTGLAAATKHPLPAHVTVANINKPTQASERFLEGTLDLAPTSSTTSTPASTASQQTRPSQPSSATSPSASSSPAATSSSSTPTLVAKLKDHPIVLSKPKSLLNELELVAKCKLGAGDLLLQEQPHCLAIDLAHNKSHCAACMQPLGSSPKLCPGCGLVHYCSLACVSHDLAGHQQSGECAWCRARDPDTNPATHPDHAVVRLALRLLQARPKLESLDGKILDKVPRYGQWLAAAAARLKPDALAAMQPVLQIWRSRITALQAKVELAQAACPSVDAAVLKAAVLQAAVAGTQVQDLAGGPRALAVYSLAPFLRHSCCPNAQMTFNGKELQLRALRAVAPAEPITVALVDLHCPAIRRRNSLLQRYGSTCTCPRCKTPKEIQPQWEGQLGAWKKAVPQEQREALLARWQDRISTARQLLALGRARAQVLPKVEGSLEETLRQCTSLLGSTHFLVFQVRLLQAQLAEVQKDWQAIAELAPWLLLQLEQSHPANHPLLGWLSRCLATALHWLAENRDAGLLQRAADYAEEASCVLRVCCGPDHSATREAGVLGAVVLRKLGAL